MLVMADRASVPVCVHLDHGIDTGYIKGWLGISFASVMNDCSLFTAEENYANTSIWFRSPRGKALLLGRDRLNVVKGVR